MNGCSATNGVLKPNFSFFANEDSIAIFLSASFLNFKKFSSFSKNLVKGWSGAIAIKEAPKIVSGRVVKTLILFWLLVIKFFN